MQTYRERQQVVVPGNYAAHARGRKQAEGPSAVESAPLQDLVSPFAAVEAVQTSSLVNAPPLLPWQLSASRCWRAPPKGPGVSGR